MATRRDFIKQAALLAGSAGVVKSLPLSLQKAIAINPEVGSTFYDAEHVVLLMQENRSFDHCFGTLQGVRGFNDPRAVSLPNGNLVWLQSNEAGETYLPFRLDIKDTKATWMSSLPHSWNSQVDARNDGWHDKWLESKKSGVEEYAGMPLTLGYYQREDIPFYYALADAFTVCDQHFCSSLTATTPNRLYYFSGTVREKQDGNSPANINNSNVDYDTPANWTTFPERLQEHGISWKVYQNELSVGVGFEGEEDSWLANFTDNPLEWFSQYHVRFLPAHINHLTQKKQVLVAQINKLKAASLSDEGKKELQHKSKLLAEIEAALLKFKKENFDKLPEKEQQIHQKAFTTNVNDPDYHQLTSLNYKDGAISREMKIPRGDTLYQFRKDVEDAKLPTVSWLIAPEKFSDHPSSAWYGAWYVSEVMDILTKNPEVWKKTIFILTYDENDGYFDHIPPFVATAPDNPAAGKCSAGIDSTVEYVTAAQANALKGTAKDPERVSPIGLGYRVPFVVASPWSRGGWVNSQVFDNTSVLMFLEKFLTKKTGKNIKEENISDWRRTVCGDLTSVFRKYDGETIKFPEPVDKKPFVESIYNAQFKKIPSDFRALNKEETAAVNSGTASSEIMPQQESGIRPSCALPYEIYAEGYCKKDKSGFEISLKAGNKYFGRRSAGVPFTVYDMLKQTIRNYAVAPGDKLQDEWLWDNNNELYHYQVYGPNGFYREFKGSKANSPLMTQLSHAKSRMAGHPNGDGILTIKNLAEMPRETIVMDNAYKTNSKHLKLGAVDSKTAKITVNLALTNSHSWYDFSVKIKGDSQFEYRYAGRLESGKDSYTDPFMGRVI